MADAVEAAELLDVDVDQLAGMRPLVAAHWLGRFQAAAIEAERLRMRLRSLARAEFGGDLLAGKRAGGARLRPFSTMAAGVGFRDRCGRDDRSASPSTPSAF